MSYILLVEDNPSTAEMIVRLLTTAGFKVRHTAYGLEGMKMARHDPPTLILMDFDLPDSDGRSLVLLLKRDLARKGAGVPPIIGVTARVGNYEEYISKKLGCDVYISKPFDPEVLLATVKEQIALSGNNQGKKVNETS